MAIRELSQIDPTYPIGTPMQYGFGRQAAPPPVADGETIFWAASQQITDPYGVTGLTIEIGEIVMVSNTLGAYDVRVVGSTGGQGTEVDAMVYRPQSTLPPLMTDHAIMFLAGADFNNAWDSGVDIKQGELAVGVESGGTPQVSVLGRAFVSQSDPNNWQAPPEGKSAQYLADRTVEDIFGSGKQVSQGDMVFAVTIGGITKVFIMDFESS